jgi:hypothetical protein
MVSGKVAVISIAVVTVNLGDADVLAAGAAITGGRTADVLFFLGAVFTAGRLVTDFFFFGAAFLTFLAMVFYLLTRNFYHPGMAVIFSERTDCLYCKKYNRFLL